MAIPRFAVLSCLVALVCTSVPAAQQTTTWTGAVSDSWSDPGNWSGNLLPSPTVSASIFASARNPRTDTGGLTCLDLNVANGAVLTLDAGAPLQIAGNVSAVGIVTGSAAMLMTGSGTLGVNLTNFQVPLEFDTPGGSYDISGFFFGPVTIRAGTIAAVAGSSVQGGRFQDSVTVIGGSLELRTGNFSHEFADDLVVQAPGQLRSDAGASVVWNAPGIQTIDVGSAVFEVLTINGSAQPVVNGTLHVVGDLEVRVATTLMVSGSLQVGGLAEFYGTAQVQGAALQLESLLVRQNAVVSAPNALLSHGAGSMTVLNGSSLTLGSGRHVVQGSLTLFGPVTFGAGSVLAVDTSGMSVVSVQAGSLPVPIEVGPGLGTVAMSGTFDGGMNVAGGTASLGAGTSFFGAVFLDAVTVTSGTLELRAGNFTHVFSDDLVVQAPGQLLSQPLSSAQFNAAGAQSIDLGSGDLEQVTFASGTDANVVGTLRVQRVFTVGSSANVTISDGLFVGALGSIDGEVSVQGSSVFLGGGTLGSAGILDAPNTVLTVGSGNLISSPGSFLGLGGGRHRIEGSQTFNGTTQFSGSAVWVLESAGTMNVQVGTWPIPIEVATSAGAWSLSGRFAGAVTVLGGSLSPVSGAVFEGDLVAVAPGQFDFGFGSVTLSGSSPQIVDVGSAAFWRLLVASDSTVNVVGNLQARANLTTAGGSALNVAGDASIPQSSISGLIQIQGSSLAVGNCTVFSTGRILAPNATLVANTLVLSVGSELSLAAGRHVLEGSVRLLGTLTLGGPSVLELVASGELTLDPSIPPVQIESMSMGAWTLRGTYKDRVTTMGGTFTCRGATFEGAFATTGTSVTLTQAVSFESSLTVDGGSLQLDWQVGIGGTYRFRDDVVLRSGAQFTTDARALAVLEANGLQVFDVPDPVFYSVSVLAGAQVTGTGSWEANHLSIDDGGALTIPGGLTVLTTCGVQGEVQVQGSTLDLRVLNVTATGQFLAPNATLRAGGLVTVSTGGALTLGGGRHELRGGVTLASPNLSFGTGAVLAFLSPLTVQTFNGGFLPTVEFDPAGSPDGPGSTVTILGGTVIQGDLVHISGRLEIGFSNGGGGTVSVTRDALLGGETLFSQRPDTVLDVSRDIDFATSARVEEPPRVLECGRDWTSNAQFDPTVGTVLFDGAGAQTATAAVLPVFDLDILSGSQLTLNVDTLIVRNDAVIDAMTQAGQVSTRIEGDLAIGAAGNFELLTGTHEVLGDVVNDGIVSGPQPLRLVGSGTVRGVGQFNDVEVDTTGLVTATSNLEIQNLELLTGTFDVTGSNVVHTSGNTDLVAGTLSGVATAILDCDGDFTATGTLAGATTPNIRVSGNYAATDTFQPQTGEVILNPVGTSTLTSLSPSGQLFFPILRITEGIAQILANLELRTTQVEIDPMGQLRVEPGARAGFTCLGLGIDGTFRVLGGAEVRWDELTFAVVESGGRFELLGDPNATARVLPDLTSGWSLTVQNGGAIEARFFEMRGMADTGVVIEAGASVQMANGIFADGSSAAGAVLLNLSRDKGDQYDGLVFDTASGSTPFNATTNGPGSVTFTNYVGDPLEEFDPSNLIEWVGAGQTGLDRFQVLGDLGAVDIAWTTNREIMTTEFRLFREVISTGAVVEVVGSPVTAQGNVLAGASYALRDTGFPANERLRYELFEERPSMAPRSLGTRDVTPWPQQAGPTGFVGPGGFPDIGSALAADSGSLQVLVVSEGSYPSFTIDRSVRIVAREGSLVTIDTSGGPIEIRDATTGDIALYGLKIGDPSNVGPDALTITNVDAVVVIDGCEVAARTLAASITNSPKVAIQDSTFAGGLTISGASTTAIANGTVDLLTLGSGTSTEYLGTTIGVASVDPSASVLDLGGTAPRMDWQQQWAPESTVRLEFTGESGGIATVLAAEGPDYVDLTALFSVDMPLLIDPATTFAAISVPTPLDGNGRAVTSLFLPTLSGLTGIWIPTQLITLSQRGATLGNVRDVVIVP